MEEARLFKGLELQILREGSEISGPKGPVAIRLGVIATYAAYGINVLTRSVKEHLDSREIHVPESDNRRTQRNAWLD